MARWSHAQAKAEFEKNLQAVLASSKNADETEFSLGVRLFDNDSTRSAEVNADNALRVAQYAAEWSVVDTDTAALSLVQRAAPAAGTYLFVTSLHASYGAAQIGTLVLYEGTGGGRVERGRFHIHNQRDITLDSPLRIAVATAAEAELSAGAAGVIGTVTLTGYTGS